MNAPRTGFEPRTLPHERRGQFDQNRRFRDVMRHQGDWDPAINPGYKEGDVVRDDGWTMVCSETLCTQKPAPQPVGDPFTTYTGTSPTGSIGTAKQVVFGNRWTIGDQGGYLNAFRIYTITGNEYALYIITDPDGGRFVTEIWAGVADSTGWRQFNYPPSLVAPGSVFEVLAVVQEPDPTPTTFNGNWNYITPQNPRVPGNGEIIHPNSALGVMQISDIDNDGGDRGTELLSLDVGDIMEFLGTRYAIQSIIDRGAYIEFGVAPAVQETPDGVTNVVFETVTATPITLMVDPDYWLGPTPIAGTIQGTYKIDDGPIVLDNTAYGTDIVIQEAYISDQWDVIATPGGATGTAIDPDDFVHVTGDEMSGPLWINMPGGGLDLLFAGDANGIALNGRTIQARQNGPDSDTGQLYLNQDGGFVNIGNTNDTRGIRLDATVNTPIIRPVGPNAVGIVMQSHTGQQHINCGVVGEQTRFQAIALDSTTSTSQGLRITTASGRVQYISSSIAHKTEVEDLDDEYATTVFEALRPRWFRSILPGDHGRTRPGFIVEEVAQADKRLVGWNDPDIPDGEVPTDPGDVEPTDLDDRVILTLVVQQLKKALTRIDELEARLAH